MDPISSVQPDTGVPHVLTKREQELARDHQVQSVFSQVLAEVGRQGYQSAAPADSEVPLGEQISSAWSDWFDFALTSSHRAAEAPQELKESFGNILQQAYHDGGYADPKAFLKSLSEDQLETVRQVHWLADEIDVDGLSEEGALNLLIPRSAQVDLNQDGLTQSGAAYGIQFPDSNTPKPVVQAWEEATQDMEWRDRAFYGLQMRLPGMMANYFFDENGGYLSHFEPGDPEYRNPMAAEDYSYVDSVQTHLDYLETFKNQLDPEKFQRDTAFFQKLKDALIDAGAQ